MAAKKCTKCGETKPHSEFRKASHHKDGLTSQCKSCCNAWIRDWYVRNKESRKITQAAWHAKNKVKRNKAVLAKYYENREKWQARNKAWAKAHPERMRAFVAASDHKRRAAKLNSFGAWTEKDIQRLFKLQLGCCACCRKKLDKSFHRDHIVALASGGSNEISNIQLLCKSCNSQKHKRDPIDFMRSKGYLL